MSRSAPRAAFVVLLLGLLAATCSFPKDMSDQLFVTITPPVQLVLRGTRDTLHAVAWRRVGADSDSVTNVDVAFSSRNTALATVEKTGSRSALLTGVNSGRDTVVAQAVGFANAAPAVLPVRISEPLEVDSVRPAITRYGNVVTVFGVGADSILLASLGAADLIPYPGSASRSNGYGRMSFWVPPPAHTAPLFFIGAGVFSQARDTTRVLPFDIYEPNDTQPTAISLDAPVPFPTLFPSVQYINPALAFEPVLRGTVGDDWYRFSRATTGDLSIIINSADARGAFSTFLVDSLYFTSDTTSPCTFCIGPDAWTIGPGSHLCHGWDFEPGESQPDSTIVALAGFSGSALHALLEFNTPARYGLTVINGYVISDPRFPKDAHEEDDFCSAADAKGTQILPFRDTLTIDNPHDVDWIRFRVDSGALTRNVTIRIASIAGGSDSSDVDLYVLSVPDGSASSSLDEEGVSDNVGSNESLSLNLVPGHYYAVAVDYAGIPTQYVMCAETLVQGACGSFPAPPVFPSARTRRLAARAASGVRIHRLRLPRPPRARGGR
ncbi:MAG TPA: hypothetical protein VFK78_04855 [Gemmatimonadales bacterium]|nr:hypothetical protein [Gemmatimonadales bacterium]